MKIAIISDTHDTLDNVNKALELIRQNNCEVIFHAGDWCAPFTFQEISKAELPVFGVFGNNDGAQYEIHSWIDESAPNFFIEKDVLEKELDGKKITMNHYPNIGKMLAETGKYDLVIYGHNHMKKIEKVGHTWLVNPGSLSQRNFGGPTFAIYDTKLDTVELIEVK
jgi:uncharacterized protein